jgi:hypothetical protein
MSRKTLFFLSSDNFHAQIWQNGKLSAPTYFPNSAQGLEQLSAFLQTRHDPAYILVDLIEEDFRHEVVPHLTGANHQALVQRKFDQYYRNTPFRLARRQRRQSDGRRDDEMLFSSLTNPSRITAWLDLLLLHETPIAGIYSLPHASIPLVKEMEYDHLLLLSWEKDAGLRQSYYFNQRLRFSRLTPLNPNSTFADAVATETARTYQYLQSLSLTPQGEQLRVQIICHSADKAQLDARLSSSTNMRYAYLDLQQLGKRIKSKNTYADSDATPLFLHLLATKPPHGNYATAQHTHFYRLWQTKRGLLTLAAITALVCIVWSTLSFMEGSSVATETESFAAQTRRLSGETQHITQGFQANNLQNPDGSTVQASDMKTAVTVFRRLQNYSVPPQQILKGLTTTLDKFPRIRTAKLAWQMTDVPGAGSSGNYPAQVITFNGELSDFGNDYRNALNYLERFQLTLTQSGYMVTPIKLPLDFSSQGNISADISAGRDKPAEFSLKIIWRPQE